MVAGEGAVERDAGAERLDGLVARVREGGLSLQSDAGPLHAEGKVGGVFELQRSGEIQTGSLGYDKLAREVRPGESGSEVDARAGRARRADGSDGDRLLVGRGAYGQLVSCDEAVRVADLDAGRAGAHIRHQRRTVRLRSYFRDGHRFDAMADTLDI